MKLARRVGIAFAVTLIAGWATHSSACDKDKNTAAAAHASGACTAEMASTCTPEMAAACKMKKMNKADAQAPANNKVRFVYVSAVGSPDSKGVDAVAASSSGAAAASGKDGCCAGKATSATAAKAAGASCATKSATAGSCAAHGMGVMASGSSCAGHGMGVMASGGACSVHGMGVMASSGTMADCEACSDAGACGAALEAAGAHRQAVRLRNGVMYVYTADTQRNVSAVQAAVSRRDERMARIASAGENAHLCPECKVLRGAMASGKLTREVIEIEGGALTLITSTDPATVAKLHAMIEPTKMAARIKT